VRIKYFAESRLQSRAVGGFLFRSVFRNAIDQSDLMREAPLVKIFTAKTSAEAEAIIGWFRTAGLHPAELALTTPLVFERGAAKFPIEVPVEELGRARAALENRPRLVNA
jgi:hypothetical protein